MFGTTHNALGEFLRVRRSRLDPLKFGFEIGRRRTQGLRREEVALLANISPTWYTWLEQGRGGAPSKEVLNRIATGLMLTAPEREHLFFLAFGHPPEAHYTKSNDITPRLRRVLGALPASPTVIKTVTWDVVAWNQAAAVVLTDFSLLPPEQRNILRLLFSNSHLQNAQDDWSDIARFAVNTFRADAARVGTSEQIDQLVQELCRLSPLFETLWSNNDVQGHGDGMKRLQHPQLGAIELEFSSFVVEGRPDLNMIIYNPVNDETEQRIRTLIASRSL